MVDSRSLIESAACAVFDSVVDVAPDALDAAGTVARAWELALVIELNDNELQPIDLDTLGKVFREARGILRDYPPTVPIDVAALLEDADPYARMIELLGGGCYERLIAVTVGPIPTVAARATMVAAVVAHEVAGAWGPPSVIAAAVQSCSVAS